MAQRIVCEGREYRLSIVEISDDGRSVRIVPFTTELHSTRWVDGTLHIVRDPSGRYTIDTPKIYFDL